MAWRQRLSRQSVGAKGTRSKPPIDARAVYPDALCGLAGLVFLLEPLVRGEEDVRRLMGRLERYPGVELSTREGTTDSTAKPNRCPHCGDEVEQGYVFCGNCAGPLPTPA